MNCLDARELIQEKLDGQLDASLLHRLKEHLTRCHVCRDYESAIEVLDSALARQPLEEVPEGFAARVAENAFRRRGKMVASERRNLRIAAACVAAALVFAAILPFFITLPQASEFGDRLAAIAPEVTDPAVLSSEIASIAPPLPESTPTFSDAVVNIRSSLDAFSGIEIPVLGLTGTLVLMLGAFAAIASVLEALYLGLPYWRRR